MSDDRKTIRFDESRKANVVRLVSLFDGITDFDGEPACDVLVALMARSIGLSKQLEIGEDEFFDMVVKMYEWTHIEQVERH
jgi:hypothetical protein